MLIHKLVVTRVNQVSGGPTQLDAWKVHTKFSSYISTSGALRGVAPCIRGALSLALVCGISELNFRNGMPCIHVSRYPLTACTQPRFAESKLSTELMSSRHKLSYALRS